MRTIYHQVNGQNSYCNKYFENITKYKSVLVSTVIHCDEDIDSVSENQEELNDNNEVHQATEFKMPSTVPKETDIVKPL